MFKKLLIIAVLVAAFLPALFLTAATVDLGSQPRPRSGIDIRVTELMIQAMHARDAGDMNSAELFWIQAKAFRPSLPRPAWLNQLPEKREDYMPPSEPDLLTKVASMPYHLAKPLLEARLSQDPGNVELRKVYLKMAQENSDSAEVTRHSSALQHPQNNSLTRVMQYLLLVILAVFLIWQLFRLYRDLRAT